MEEYRKTNNPSWCCEKIQEKIEVYKLLSKDNTLELRERSIFKVIVEDLEEILYE